jgi:SAM-dependent methyltransferase
MPLNSGEYDFITTFNAVHHFNIPRFFEEAFRLLKPQGLLFIYTRTPAQNAQTIWGKCFPLFKQAETRLCNIGDFLNMAMDSKFKVEDIEIFRYGRVASLQELVRRARSFHYSTFRLIPQERFEDCVAAFERIVREVHDNPDQVKWIDSNVLFVFRKPK